MCIDWATVSSIATALSMIFVAHQSRLMKKSFRYNCEWQEKAKAVELACTYKDKILPNTSYLSTFMRITGVETLLGNLNQHNISSFTKDELLRLTNSGILDMVKSVKRNTDNLPAPLALRERCSSRVDIIARNQTNELYSSLSSFLSSPPDKEQMDKALFILWSEFNEIQIETLNSLEFFAMNFTSEVADETMVFQSLHQTYLNIVQLLYYQIAIRNTNVKDKYYTNIIALYHTWSARDLENENKANEAVFHPSSVSK